MNMDTYLRETAIHKKVYERLRERIREDHAGQYVVLTQGRMFTAATFDEANATVERLNPVPEYSLIFPAEIEPDFGLAYDIWERVM